MSNENNEPDTGTLDQVVADYIRACDAGTPPDREQILRQYSDLAEDLHEFFRHRDRMKSLLDPLRSAAARVLNIRCPHCRNSIEMVDDANISSIKCPSCGSDFSLIGSSKRDQPKALERIGQFKLIEQVGVGQFGAVWKARDLTLERTVAIKIPRSRHLSATDVEVFLRDARVSAHLKHPNIVSVHEVGKHEDAIYIVSDFIQGSSLKDWMAKRRPTIRESVRLCATIARALDYAHESGVVHRDLKPGNIMMDLGNEPHIVDFGLAKHDAGEITMTVDGQILGTPAYMPPEQARGDAHHADPTADIYSLGVVLFELLTEELPFRGDKQMLLTHILNSAPPSPRRLNSKIPRDLETICLKCLEKEPRNRYPSAHEFALECRRFLDGAPVSARPVSAIVKGVRWCCRNPIVAGLSAAVVLLAVGIAATTSVGLIKAQRASAVLNDRAETIEENLYFSEMSRAGQAALNSGGLTEVRRLLAHWRPENTRVDRRNWEWRYLNSLLHEDVVTLKAHVGGVFALDWSHDGRHLASGSSDWSVKIWSNDGRAIHKLSGHTAAVHDVDWNRKTGLLASAGDDGIVRITDAVNGKPITTVGHAGPVTSVGWSPNGERLATVSATSAIDTASGMNQASQLTIWDTTTWKPDVAFQSPVESVSTVAWSPNGDQIAIARRSGKISIVDSINGDLIASIGPQTGRPQHLGWSHDGKRLAYTYDRSALIHVWDIDDQQETVHKVAASVSCLAWHPSRSVLAYSDGNRSIQVRDYTSGSEVRTIRGHVHRVTSVCWHPQGNHLATGDIQGNVKVWQTSGATDFLEGSAMISWHPDGHKFATRAGRFVLVRDTKPGPPVHRLAVDAAEIISLAWNPDGTRIASYGYDNVVQIWNVAKGETRCKIKTQLAVIGARFPQIMSWHPDGRQLAIAYDDRTIRIVDGTTGDTVVDLNADFKLLSAIAWDPQGNLLASGSHDSIVRIFDVRSGSVLLTSETLDLSYPINSIDWFPTGQSIAFSASEFGVVLWDLNGKDKFRRLAGHNTYVNSVCWNPNGSRIASADESGSVRIWDPKTGQQALTLEYPGPVSDLAWSPAGNILSAVTYGGGKTVRLWDASDDKTETVYW